MNKLFLAFIVIGVRSLFAVESSKLSLEWIEVISRTIQYVTLPDSWPIVAEFTPVSLDRMVAFKYACMAYIGGLINYKPPVNPSVETWIDQHTKLFRRYSVSLEARIFKYLNTFGGDEFFQGSQLISFINRIEQISKQELEDCNASIVAINQEIQVLNDEVLANYSQAKSKAQELVDTLFIKATGTTSDVLTDSIWAELDNLAQLIANNKKFIEQKTFLKNEAFVNGISIDWVRQRINAQDGLRQQSEIDLDTSISQNSLDQLTLTTKLEFCQFAQDYLTSPNFLELYGQDLFDAVKLHLMTRETDIKVALEQKRIDCDQGLLGGIYNPDDYASMPPESSYMPRQVKMVSFSSFKTAWDEASFYVFTQEELDSWKLNFI